MNPPLALRVYIKEPWGWNKRTQYLIEFDRDAYVWHLGPFAFRWGFVKSSV